MISDSELADQEAIEYLLQFWLTYTPNIKTEAEQRLDLSTLVDGETVRVYQTPEMPVMTVTRTANEFDVRGVRNRGYTVFSTGDDGLMLGPTREQLRRFMVKSLNKGVLDKHIFRPLMQDRNRFDLATCDILGIRGE